MSAAPDRSGRVDRATSRNWLPGFLLFGLVPVYMLIEGAYSWDTAQTCPDGTSGCTPPILLDYAPFTLMLFAAFAVVFVVRPRASRVRRAVGLVLVGALFTGATVCLVIVAGWDYAPGPPLVRW